MALSLVLVAPVAPKAGDSVDIPLPLPRPAVPDATGSDPPLPQSRPPIRAPAGANDTPAGAAPVEETQSQIYQTACPAVLSGSVLATMMPPIDDGTCQVRSPLSATAVRVGAGQVDFSSPAIIGCSLAGQLAEWVVRVSAYAEVMFKSPVAELLVGTSFECRPRNHEDGAKVSEHGFADAIDVVGFRLKDGTLLSVSEDWTAAGPEARAVHYAHDAACGLFTTVLGPDANALHKDHLHLDLGCHGQACTYRLCQ